MSKWICNAPYPGSQIMTEQGSRVIRPGVEFETTDEVEARQLWWPVDQAARDAVTRAKIRAKELGGVFRTVALNRAFKDVKPPSEADPSGSRPTETD